MTVRRYNFGQKTWNTREMSKSMLRGLERAHEIKITDH